MPRRLGALLLPMSRQELEELCHAKGLNDFETELILRIYWQRQSINFIADTMDFRKYGRNIDYYSVRTINYLHKEAFLKITTR